MGNIVREMISKCPACGADDIWYKLSINNCIYCGAPIEYNTFCTCISNGAKLCNECNECEEVFNGESRN